MIIKNINKFRLVTDKSSPFSSKIITSELIIPLFVSAGFITFQNSLLFRVPFSVAFLKYSDFARSVRMSHSRLASLYATKFSLDFHLLYLVLNLDLFMIAVLSSFVTKGLLLPLIFLDFKGACLSTSLRTFVVKISYLSISSFSKSLLKLIASSSSMNTFSSNFL